MAVSNLIPKETALLRRAGFINVTNLPYRTIQGKEDSVDVPRKVLRGETHGVYNTNNGRTAVFTQDNEVWVRFDVDSDVFTQEFIDQVVPNGRDRNLFVPFSNGEEVVFSDMLFKRAANPNENFGGRHKPHG